MLTDLLIRADRDALTGVINRAAFYRDAAAYSDEAPACVLLADIDPFKAINDELDEMGVKEVPIEKHDEYMKKIGAAHRFLPSCSAPAG